MDNASLRSDERRYDFDTCVFSLGKRQIAADGEAHAVDGEADAVSRVAPHTLIESLFRYCETRDRMTFWLILDDPIAAEVGDEYLEQLFGEIEVAAVRGIQIRPILRSVGPRTYQRSMLERIGRLQGSVCFEIPEHLPQHGPEFSSHFAEAIRFAYEGAVGLVPLRIQVQASPGMAPAAFLRGIQRLHCSTLDVLWPRHFTPDHPPWSSRFAMTQADYSASPVYGQWFSDLFRLWWILDNPRLSIESFRGLVGRFDETSARQLKAPRRAFCVSAEGEFALPRRAGGDCLADVVPARLYVQAADVTELEILGTSTEGALTGVDALSVDRNYFSLQVRGILAQDCFQEFFYAGQDGVSLDGA